MTAGEVSDHELRTAILGAADADGCVRMAHSAAVSLGSRVYCSGTRLVGLRWLAGFTESSPLPYLVVAGLPLIDISQHTGWA